MKRIIITIAILLGSICVSGCSDEDTKATIEAMTTGREDIVVTVGVWDNGDMYYQLYGMDGQELPWTSHTYAIGSITKTFTGSLLAKEVSEGMLDINKEIDEYLPIKDMNSTPTIRSLITHTSGLGEQWEQVLEEDQEVSFTRSDMLRTLEMESFENEKCDANYSNFGSALAGTVAAELQQGTYEDIMNQYICEDLGLMNTQVGGEGDLSNYWKWKNDDEMMASGAIISNVEDMLKYGKMHLSEEPSYLSISHEPLEVFSEDYDCGYFWLIDKENDMVWHNGEICMENELGEEVGFQSFLGFSKERNRVVVVLSNAISYDEDGNAYTDILGYQLMTQ